MDPNSRVIVGPEELASLANYSGAPWNPNNQYFAKAEPHMAGLWANLIWPFISDCDFSHVIDLAAGHGRNTAVLLERAGHVVAMDIQAGNVEVCRRRFAGNESVSFITNDGFDFRPVGDSVVTLVYCFDAMVHFDSDVVRSYLRDAHRVLVPGGRAFLHHSNYTGGHDWRQNPSARNFMSQELFEHYAIKEQFRVLRQRTINWGGNADIDCLSLIEKS